MKLNRILVLLAATGIVASCSTGCVTEEKREAKLQAEAKISKEQAEKTALAKVPGGTIKEGELEKEKGKLIWSFDISTPNSTDIKEVQVDAITGEVASVKTESAAAEAKEKKKEKEEDEKDEKK
jgi:Peptidase propeptide and YPEB domain